MVRARNRHKLLIDLDASARTRDWTVRCSYYHRPANDGGAFLRELATFAVFCRHCREGTCIKACPTDALRRGGDGIVRRSSMLCVKCHSCVIACPFGTIMEDLIPLATSRCDYCLGRLNEDEAPLCAQSCTDESVRFGEFAEDPEQNIFAFDENVLIHSKVWQRHE